MHMECREERDDFCGHHSTVPALFDSLHPAERKTQLRQHSRLPPFAKYAKDGAPTLLLKPERSKPGPPAVSLANLTIPSA